MKKMLLTLLAAIALTACGGASSPTADQRQAEATRTALDGADREIGMPRIRNFSQRRLLKNAYEDMDTTTLTYVYSQAIDGRFVCIGQAIGYGVSLGTQFTSPTTPEYPGVAERGIYARPQAEPNGLFMPESGAATIVNLINPVNGEAHTALMEANINTVPFPLPAHSVVVPCGPAIDPTTVRDAQEQNAVRQR